MKKTVAILTLFALTCMFGGGLSLLLVQTAKANCGIPACSPAKCDPARCLTVFSCCADGCNPPSTYALYECCGSCHQPETGPCDCTWTGCHSDPFGNCD